MKPGVGGVEKTGAVDDHLTDPPETVSSSPTIFLSPLHLSPPKLSSACALLVASSLEARVGTLFGLLSSGGMLHPHPMRDQESFVGNCQHTGTPEGSLQGNLCESRP